MFISNAYRTEPNVFHAFKVHTIRDRADSKIDLVAESNVVLGKTVIHPEQVRDRKYAFRAIHLEQGDVQVLEIQWEPHELLPLMEGMQKVVDLEEKLDERVFGKKKPKPESEKEYLRYDTAKGEWVAEEERTPPETPRPGSVKTLAMDICNVVDMLDSLEGPDGEPGKGFDDIEVQDMVLANLRKLRDTYEAWRDRLHIGPLTAHQRHQEAEEAHTAEAGNSEESAPHHDVSESSAASGRVAGGTDLPGEGEDTAGGDNRRADSQAPDQADDKSNPE